MTIKFFEQKFEMMSRELKIKFKHIFNFFVYKRDVHLCHGLVEKEILVLKQFFIKKIGNLFNWISKNLGLWKL